MEKNKLKIKKPKNTCMGCGKKSITLFCNKCAPPIRNEKEDKGFHTTGSYRKGKYGHIDIYRKQTETIFEENED